MKDYLTIKEAASLTGIGESTLCVLAAKGEVFAVKEKHKWYIRTDDVLNLNINIHKEHTRPNRKATKLEVNELNLDTLPVGNWDEIIKEIRLPKHAKAEDLRNWDEIPMFTYKDLIEQYKRGLEEGIRRASIKTEVTSC